MTKKLILTALAFVFILLTIGIVSAATFTASVTPTSVNEDVSYLYNFTVQNTNTTANITQVNITLPTGFSLTADTNGTSVSGVSFSNTSTVLTFNKTPLILNGTTEYFWFNATAATPGTYNFTVTTLDTSSVVVSNETNSITVNDTTNPDITINTPSASSWNKADFIVNATVTDASTLSAVEYRYENSTANGTWTAMSNPSGNYWNATFNISSVGDGNYTFRINATDAGGNSNSTETVFTYVDDTNPTISSFTQTKTDTITVGESISASDFSCSASDNSESFGGSVSTSITGFETGTTGSKTSTCTATDSAGNTDTSNVSYTVYSAGNAGAGAGVVSEPTSTEIIPEVKPGEVGKFTKLDSKTGIEEIRIEVNETATSVKISAKKLADKPTGVKVAPNILYRYLQITATNINEDNLKSAVIQFRVDRDWLTNNSIDNGSIVLYRWFDNKWNALSTKIVGQDADNIFYEAQTPGFSYFAITGEAVVEEVAEVVEEVVPEAAPAAVPIPAEAITQTGAFIAVILIVIAGLIAYYFVFRKPPKEEKPSKLKGKYVKLKLPKRK